MINVNFYDEVADELLEFAVIVSKSNDKWVFCKHKQRDTFELPGGHREVGEKIYDTAVRELQEETGAIDFKINPICVYSVSGKTNHNKNGEESFGMLYFSEIYSFKESLQSEMEYVELLETIPSNLTYPMIQPKLFAKVLEVIVKIQ